MKKLLKLLGKLVLGGFIGISAIFVIALIDISNDEEQEVQEEVEVVEVQQEEVVEEEQEVRLGEFTAENIELIGTDGFQNVREINELLGVTGELGDNKTATWKNDELIVNVKFGDDMEVLEVETVENKETREQKNAVRKAEDYLDFTAFSRKGLIEQLEFEGFSTEDATYGVDNITVDWNEQAFKKAEDYLDIMSFSKDGLKQQLEFDGFTTEQINYAIEQLY